jgi:Leucine-rich repeat (LRR) protein
MKKVKITEGHYNLLKENFDPKEMEGLKDFLFSGQKVSIELAFTIMEGQGVKDLVLEELFGDLLGLLGTEYSERRVKGILLSGVLDLSKYYVAVPMKVLPSFIGKYTFLKELNLYSNALTDLPKELSNLKRLELLQLSNNDFQEIPSVIFGMTNLQELYLGYNSIRKIPDEIGNLQNLEYIHLSANPVAYDEEELSKLRELLPNCHTIKT